MVSNLEPHPDGSAGQADAAVLPPASTAGADLLSGRDVPLGRYTTVRRLLPHRARRMVGAWCFVDHFGPDAVAGRPGLQVPPHPHTGLQTVTWLLDGEVLHRDSLGNARAVRPGQLNLMTAGHGIAHSEESPPQNRPPGLHGLQLWIALPEPARGMGPAFAHHAALPVLDDTGASVTLLVGALGGVESPAVVHSPLVGADICVAAGGRAVLPLEPDFEYALLVTEGAAEVAGRPLEPGGLLYLGRPGRPELVVTAPRAARLFLIGGAPFEEPLVMWWNFVGRSHEEIVRAREDWAAERRFGTVSGYPGDRLPAPALPTARLKARDRHGRPLPEPA